ncbi:MAG: hypothetical protein EKE20_16170 [Candidatus Symbiopectobacterium sp. Dall1.0]|nr:hypothetical protein [Candidatus Symbiopectobacterium sp. Dall1.0]
MKKWLTIDELVELRLPNLPSERSAMSRRATKEGWPRRKRSTGNRGVTYEYKLDKSGIEQPNVLRTETPSMTNTPLNLLCEQLEVLTEEEIQDLVQMVKRKGAETLLYLLDDDNINLLKLDRVIKDKVLGKHYPEDDEQVALNDTSGRECGPDGKNKASEEILTSYSKRAV